MSCLTKGYTLTEILISLILFSLVALLTTTGLQAFKDQQNLKQDLKAITLSLEFASAEASLNQKIFIILKDDTLTIQKSNTHASYPQEEDTQLHTLHLKSQNTRFLLQNFGNSDWITLDPHHQEAFQNYTLRLIQSEQLLPQRITVSTTGDINLHTY